MSFSKIILDGKTFTVDQESTTYEFGGITHKSGKFYDYQIELSPGERVSVRPVWMSNEDAVDVASIGYGVVEQRDDAGNLVFKHDSLKPILVATDSVSKDIAVALIAKGVS